jgi:hypothetical protein
MNLAHDDKKRAEYIRFGHLSRFSTKRHSEQTGFALPMVYAGLLRSGRPDHQLALSSPRIFRVNPDCRGVSLCG